MVTFAVEKVSDFVTVQGVSKLIRNDKCLLDRFLESIENTNLESELGTLYQIIEDVANCKSLPKTKCNTISLGKGVKYQGYEAKSHHLRLYFFHDKETGQILVIGGKKKTQEKDISRLRQIVKDYQSYKQSQK